MPLRPFTSIPQNLREWTRWIKEAIVDGQVGTNDIDDNAVTLAKLAQLGALSVLGNAVNSTADVAAIAAASNDTLLRRTANALSFGQLTAGMFPATVVPDAALSTAVAIRTTNTYTATLTGCTTSPTGTVAYEKIGTIVVLSIPGITGTSNATSATLTGAPAAIRPTNSQTMLMRVIDNAAGSIGTAVMDSAGTITLGLGITGSSFTNSGTKGTLALTLAYPLA
jgi:hypothetical protein